MKQYEINGIKVYDYAAKFKKDDPAGAGTFKCSLPPCSPAPELPPSNIVEEIAKRHRALEEQHKARYNDGALVAAEEQFEEARKKAHEIADQLLYEHEGPYYRYCATGTLARMASEFKDGTPWAARRKFLQEKCDRYRSPDRKLVPPKRSWWKRLFR